MENVILRQQLQQARDELERRVEEHAAELSRAKALSEHEIAEREAAVEEVKESRRQVLGACLNTRPLTGPAQSPIQGKKLVPKVIISPASTIYCA